MRLGPVSVRLNVRVLVVAGLLAVALVASMALHVAFGGTPMPYPEVLRALLGDTSDPRTHLAVTEFRAPRMVAGVVVGASLAAAGAITQTVARNPLASPDLLGVTAGASLGAVTVLVIAGGGHAGLSGAAATVGMPVTAFTAGIGLAVYMLAYRRGNWETVQPMAVSSVVLLGAAVFSSRWLLLTSLGEDTAVGLGARIGAVRLTVLTIAVLLASVATVTAGPVAFVALASPQIARSLTSCVVPPVAVSALVGSVFALLADTVSANALAAPLPVGVATAVVGAPFLIHLILKYQRRLS